MFPQSQIKYNLTCSWFGPTSDNNVPLLLVTVHSDTLVLWGNDAGMIPKVSEKQQMHIYLLWLFIINHT